MQERFEKVRRSRSSVIGIVLVYVVMISALVGGSSGQASAKTKPLKIGATSNFAHRQGIQLKKILEMNADLVNEAGGLAVKGERYHIQVIVYDDGYKADKARAAFERLIFQDGVKFIIGTYGSAPLRAGAGITEQNKVPVFHGAVSPEFLTPKYKYLTHTYNFVHATLYALWKVTLARNPTDTVAMVEYDSVTGHAMARMHKKLAGRLGFKLNTLFMKHGATDVSPIATKIKSLNPGLFRIGSVMGSAEIFRLIKATQESGWKGPMESAYLSLVLPEIVEKLGKEAVEGTIVAIKDPTRYSFCPKELIAFRKNYEKRYGKWETDAIEWVGGWDAFLALVKKADSLDPDELMAAREGLVFDSPRGLAKLLPRPDMKNPNYIESAFPRYVGVVKDGKAVHFRTLSADDIVNAGEEQFGMQMLP